MEEGMLHSIAEKCGEIRRQIGYVNQDQVVRGTDGNYEFLRMGRGYVFSINKDLITGKMRWRLDVLAELLKSTRDGIVSDLEGELAKLLDPISVSPASENK